MRCLACNVELNDYESTRRNNDGEYLDLCHHCYNSVSRHHFYERRGDEVRTGYQY